MGQSLTKDHGTTRELINAGDAELNRKVNRNFTLSSPACIALAALVSLDQVEEQSCSQQSVSCILVS